MENQTVKSPLVLSQTINLKDDEIAKLLSEDAPNICVKHQRYSHSINANGQRVLEENLKFHSTLKGTKGNTALISRSKLILKILEKAKNQLLASKHSALAKGLTWLSNELSKSFLLKPNDLTLSKINQLKNENEDMKYIVSWLEEYSTIKLNEIAKEKLQLNNNIVKNPNKMSFSEVRSLIKEQNCIKVDNKDIKYNKKRNDEIQHNEINENFLSIKDDLFKDIEKPTFNIFKLDEAVGKENTLSLISIYIFNKFGFYNLINYSIFENFVQAITNGYIRNNPYHNDIHAADVAQTCMILALYCKIDTFAKLDIYNLCALFLSSIVHDFKHPGVNNAFLINTSDRLAIKYNDLSVLENYHIAQTFKLIKSSPKYNIFSALNNTEYTLLRKRMLNCVLATDMVKHESLYSFIKLTIEKYNISKGQNAGKIFNQLNKVELYDTQQMFMDLMIHTCDVSNPTKPSEVYMIWANRVMNEFFLQGDKEKQLGMKVSFLCDRETTSIAQGQIGFIEGVVMPFTLNVVEIFPVLEFMIKNMKDNKVCLQKMKENEEKEQKGKSMKKNK